MATAWRCLCRRPGWRSGQGGSDAEHVCGVLDVRRRPDGHDALLPWCTQRVESFLGRRQIADAPLTSGELGTLVASVLRGLRELGGEESTAGDWWLTGDGRPIFVHGEGGAPRARTASLVERTAQHTVDRTTIRILDEVIAALRQARHHVGDERRWEDQLFAIAAPRALRLDVFAPERVSGVNVQQVVGAQTLATARAMRRQSKADRGESKVHDLVADLRAQVTQLVPRLTHREGKPSGAAPRSSRARSLLLAGCLGVAVLGIGLMWPNGAAEDDAEAASQPTVVPIAPSSDPEASLDDADALRALPALLAALQVCAAESASTCPDAVAEKSQTPKDGVVVLGADASTAVLVEDYGDVAVVRLTPEAKGAEQMLVLERDNELWLLRDVYDVAKQPE